MTRSTPRREGKQASAHAYRLSSPPPPPVGLDATTVSSSPSFSSSSILPDTRSLPPAQWLRQADRTVSQSRCCVQRPARGTGRIGPMRALGAGAPQPGRGTEAEWAVLPQSACGRGRAGTSSRRGVDGGGDDDVPQSSGWARRCRPCCAEGSAVSGGGPTWAAAPWAGDRRARAGEARGGGGRPGRGDLRRGPGVGRPGAGVVPDSAGPRGGSRRPSGCRRPGPPRGAAAGRWAPPPGRSTTTLPRGPRLRRTRRRRRRGRGRPRRMEERKEEGEAEIQEHGPEHWFSKWERQCLAEAEQDEQLSPELQEEAAAAAQPEHKQQKLWHLFQNSATAVAQLYKGEARRRHLAAAAAPPPRRRRRLGVGGEPRGRPSAHPPAGPGRAAAPPPPRRPLPTRWRRGGRARRGAAAERGACAGGAPVWGRSRGPARCWGPAAGAPGPGGQGRGPRSQNGEGRRRGRPIVPERASGRRLGGGASIGRGRSWGCASGPRGSPWPPSRPPSCSPHT